MLRCHPLCEQEDIYIYIADINMEEAEVAALGLIIDKI